MIQRVVLCTERKYNSKGIKKWKMKQLFQLVGSGSLLGGGDIWAVSWRRWGSKSLVYPREEHSMKREQLVQRLGGSNRLGLFMDQWGGPCGWSRVSMKSGRGRWGQGTDGVDHTRPCGLQRRVWLLFRIWWKAVRQILMFTSSLHKPHYAPTLTRHSCRHCG